MSKGPIHMASEDHSIQMLGLRTAEIYCTATWAIPDDTSDRIWTTESGKRYTFDKSLVDCPKCLALIYEVDFDN